MYKLCIMNNTIIIQGNEINNMNNNRNLTQTQKVNLALTIALIIILTNLIS